MTAERLAEPMRGSGFSDWQRKMREIGNHHAAAYIERLDPDMTQGERNTHTRIAEELRMLELPIQQYISVPVHEFLAAPSMWLDHIADGEYYFASIVPSVHLAHGMNRTEVIELAEMYAQTVPESELRREIYISHNGEPVMSGHIIVRDDGEPNTILCEFTTGNFNAFHRGSHTPEISVQRHYKQFSWGFRDQLADDIDWRTDEEFTCQGNIMLNRIEMAERIYDAITRIPHDGDYYLPGYYEVLLEHTVARETTPVFIEANFNGTYL